MAATVNSVNYQQNVQGVGCFLNTELIKSCNNALAALKLHSFIDQLIQDKHHLMVTVQGTIVYYNSTDDYKKPYK